MTSLQSCICIDGNYLRSCPYTFEQGGGIFHCHGGNLQAVKAGIEASPWNSDDDSEGSQLIDDFIENLKQNSPAISNTMAPNRGCEMEVEIKTQPRMFARNHQDFNTKKSLPNFEQPREIRDAAQAFMLQNRIDLKRFDALQINGKSLTDYSIGGFKIDIPKTAEAVKKIAPLPPSALPKIFIDDNLNFFHHFFKGMEALLGVQMFQKIIASKFHHDDSRGDLALSLVGFMESGLVSTDNALTMFVKKVLSSTFERSAIDEGREEITVLLVSSNLWGFRYIEPGMLLKDVEIRMWLEVCFNHYRTLWFDTFKSSGVPSFAVEGVLLDHSNALLKIETDKRIMLEKDQFELDSAKNSFKESMALTTRALDDHNYYRPRRPRHHSQRQKKSFNWF